MGIVARGKETLYDSNDSPIASLSLDRCTLPADASGVVTSYAGAVSTISILLSGVDDSSAWSVTCAASGLSGSLSGKTYTVSSMSAESGYVDFTAKKTGYADLVKRFHVGKVRQGAPGSPGNPGSPGAPGSSAWYAYHDNPPITQPATPTGNGTDNGWHETLTSASIWISTKQAVARNDAGTWNPPVLIASVSLTPYYAPKYLGIGQLSNVATAAFSHFLVSTSGVVTTDGNRTPNTGDWMYNNADTPSRTYYRWSGTAWETSTITSWHRSAGVEDILRLLKGGAIAPDGIAYIEALLGSQAFFDSLSAKALYSLATVSDGSPVSSIVLNDGRIILRNSAGVIVFAFDPNTGLTLKGDISGFNGTFFGELYSEQFRTHQAAVGTTIAFSPTYIAWILENNDSSMPTAGTTYAATGTFNGKAVASVLLGMDAGGNYRLLITNQDATTLSLLYSPPLPPGVKTIRPMHIYEYGGSFSFNDGTAKTFAPPKTVYDNAAVFAQFSAVPTGLTLLAAGSTLVHPWDGTFSITKISKTASEIVIYSDSSRTFNYSNSGYGNYLTSINMTLAAAGAGADTTNLYPQANNTYDIGLSSNKYRYGYFGACYGAVGNDFADALDLPTEKIEPGYVACIKDGGIALARKRNDRTALGIVSDTYSFRAGVVEHGAPIAVAGYVLAHVVKAYAPGTRLTVAKNGLLTRAMPWERVLALFIEKPRCGQWNSVGVNGRAVVKVVR
ncbi:hypothetical protein SDC9_05172 [bioreactor metagenome]|uniref:Uncharacterized protein n=1 Tax=bioreactor metagenome TaxID=1076179 RepID=A0A644SY50_9ZZZZ